MKRASLAEEIDQAKDHKDRGGLPQQVLDRGPDVLKADVQTGKRQRQENLRVLLGDQINGGAEHNQHERRLHDCAGALPRHLLDFAGGV